MRKLPDLLDGDSQLRAQNKRLRFAYEVVPSFPVYEGVLRAGLAWGQLSIRSLPGKPEQPTAGGMH